MKITLRTLFLMMLLCATITAYAQAGEYSCEVMTLNGQAEVLKADGSTQALKQGDLLAIGDTVLVGDASFVDVAYDKEWNNVTRFWAGSKVRIKSVFPTGIEMSKGDVFARLAKLPAKSTFEIETPTAVAAVRGSAYRTVTDGATTDVYNLHDSEVEVHSKNADGQMMEDKVILKENEKTEVDSLGEAPKTPEKMSEEEIAQNKELVSNVDQTLAELKDEGREGRIQDIQTIEREYEPKLAERLENFQESLGAKSVEGTTSPERDVQTLIDAQEQLIEKNIEAVDRTIDRDRDQKDRRRERRKDGSDDNDDGGLKLTR